ncbi:MAG TPA: signal peptidase II [Candidatus Dormibacteraeota bacterium]|jgi:signal peptidase II|nr:signal peptidase II [Candidatus Dormibacteraeota bacterium]
MLAGRTAVAAGRRASRRRIYTVVLGTAAAVALVDHITKWVVASNIPLDGEIWRGSFVSIGHVENSGAAFSVLPQLHWLYLAVAVIVSLYILLAGYRYGTTWYRQVLIGMILGGALSNGVDRLVQGSVVDFIDFHFWPVFNVADSCIVIAILVLLVLSFIPSSNSPTSSTSSAPS